MQTTVTWSMPRSRTSGSVRAAFSTVDEAVSSRTSSPLELGQIARICSASETPPSGAHPLNTTSPGSCRSATRAACATTRRQAGLMR